MMARGVDQAGKVYALETGFLEGMAISTTLVGTGVTPGAALGSGGFGALSAWGARKLSEKRQ